MIAFDAAGIVAWLATYAVHSTVLIAGALLLARILPSDGWRETAWKAALVGGFVTATAQVAAGVSPATGEWRLPLLAGQEAFAVPGAHEAPTRAASVVPAAGVPETVDGVSAAAVAEREPIGTLATAAEDAAPTTSRTEGLLGGGLAGAILLAWLAGAAFLVARLARRHLRLARLLADRRIVREPRTLRILAQLQRSAGVWRSVRLTASSACATPLALGAREICVPERLLALDDERQRSALAHELAHVARRDPHWHMAASVLEAVFFFQPLHRAARRALRDAAEHLADDWAVRHTGSPLGLARCLAEVASWVGPTEPVPAGTLAMAEGGSPLLKRVERLLAGGAGEAPRPAGVRVAAAALLLAGVAVVAPAVSASPWDASASPLPAPEQDALPAAEAAGTPTPAALPAWQPPVPDAATRALWAQEQVIAHPDPTAPLAQKWAWAEREAEGRGDRSRWVAWSIERPLRGGSLHVEDSHGWHTGEGSGRTLGQLLFGPAFQAPEHRAGVVRQPMVFLFRLEGDRIDRVSARSPGIGMDLGGRPVYWLGPTAQPQSLAWLQERLDHLGEVRLQSTLVELAAMHEDSERVVPWLAGIIRSGRPYDVREEAVEGLEWHPTSAAAAILREVALGDDEVELRAEAAETLAELLPGAAAEAALLDVVRSNAPHAVREEAVEGMAERGSAAVTAELVRLAMEDPSADLQEEAVEALADRPAAEAAPLLERIARTHPSARIQEEAVEALAEVDPARAHATLEALLGDARVSEALREEAVDALADLRTPAARDALFRAAMADPSPRIQAEAAEALAEFGADAAPLLERLIWEHPVSGVRAEATEAVADLPAERAAAILDRVIREHEDTRVVHEALDALEDLPEELALPILIRAAQEHPRPDVREEAREKIGDGVKRRRP